MLCVFAAGFVAVRTFGRGYSLSRWNVKVYLSGVAVASLAVLALAVAIWLHAISQTNEQAALDVVLMAVVILTPASVTSVAMWAIDRSPTLEELNEELVQ